MRRAVLLGATGIAVGGWAAVRRMMRSQAVAFWGDAAVHWAVLLGGGRPWDAQRAHGQRHLGGCGGALGGVVRREVAM